MKGYIERLPGSGVRPEAIQRQACTTLLGNKRLFGITTSAATGIWLNEQGQEQGLRSVLDQYLMHAVGMHSQGYLRFDHITAKLSRHFAGQFLLEVTGRVQRICAKATYADEAVLHEPGLIGQSSCGPAHGQVHHAPS